MNDLLLALPLLYFPPPSLPPSLIHSEPLSIKSLFPSHLQDSHSDDNTDLEERPPEHADMTALDRVPVTRFSGLEEVLMRRHFVQLVSYGVQLFLYTHTHTHTRKKERGRGERG